LINGLYVESQYLQRYDAHLEIFRPNFASALVTFVYENIKSIACSNRCHLFGRYWALATEVLDEPVGGPQGYLVDDFLV
jgi:hypothetical protein